MKYLARVGMVVVLVAFIGACTQTRADYEERLPSDSAQGDRVPGEYLVGLAIGTDPAVVRTMFSVYGIEEWRHIRKDTYLVRLRSDPGPEVMSRLAADAATVRYVEPNRIYTTQ